MPTPDSDSTRSPVLLGALAFSVVAWASAFVAIRHTVEHLDPGSLALGRLALGSVALGCLLAARRRWVAPTRREWGLLVLCGITWFALYNLCLNAAEQHVDAGTTSMLVNVGPIFIALLAGALLGEGYPPWLMAGFAVAFGGVLIIGFATTTGSATVGGVLLCLAAAVVYAVGVLAQKPVLRRIPALQVTWIACTIGAVASLPFAGQLRDDLGTVSAATVLDMVYLAVVPLAIAFSTWSYALARMPAGRIAVTVYAVPPVTVLLGWVLLGEVPPALAFVGGVVCLVGVGLSRHVPRPRPLRGTEPGPALEPVPAPVAEAPVEGSAT